MLKIFVICLSFVVALITGLLGIFIAPVGLIDGVRNHDSVLFFGTLAVCTFLGLVSFFSWKLFQRLTNNEPKINGTPTNGSRDTS